MPREPEPSLNERQFILQALEDNLRLDGRGFDDARSVEITFGDAYGTVDVQMGKTR
jgi:exosome complex component RRP45